MNEKEKKVLIKTYDNFKIEQHMFSDGTSTYYLKLDGGIFIPLFNDDETFNEIMESINND